MAERHPLKPSEKLLGAAAHLARVHQVVTQFHKDHWPEVRAPIIAEIKKRAGDRGLVPTLAGMELAQESSDPLSRMILLAVASEL